VFALGRIARRERSQVINHGRWCLDSSTVMGLLGATPMPPAHLPGSTVHPLLTEWLTWLTKVRKVSPETIRAYLADVRQLMAFVAKTFQTTDPLAITPSMLIAFVDQLTALSASSVNGVLTSMGSLFRWLHATGRAPSNITICLGRPKKSRLLPRFMSEEEINELLRATLGPTPREIRLHAILHVFYATGIRVSELSTITLANLDVTRGNVLVLGKGNAERYCELYRDARAAVRTWLAVRTSFYASRNWAHRDDGWLFINFRDGRRLTQSGVRMAMREWAQRSGFSRRLHPHLMRHSFGTIMDEHGVPLRVLQEMMGHTSIATTQIYTHVTASRRKEVYRRAHPLA